MKTLKIIASLLLLTVIFSCSNDDNENKAPEAFTIIGPEGAFTNVMPEFTWNASSSTNGEIVYTLFAGLEADPSTIIADNISITSFTPTTAFAHSETYNWKVQAKDASGNITHSNILSFTTKSLNVYVTGNIGNSFSERIRVWENGIESTLTDDTRQSRGESIFVSGDDVYVAGFERTEGFKYVAKVWKNGVPTILTDGSKDAIAFSVFVSGTDVYVTGFETNANNKRVATLWKNGIASQLTDGNKNAQAQAVFVVGSDVYVAGFDINANNKNVATVWKNGVASALTDGVESSGANSIYVVDNDVYVAGSESNGTKPVAKVWKNGIPTILTDGNKTAFTTSVFVSGDDVYVGGYEDNIDNSFAARIWKNGSVLLSKEERSVILSVFVAGNDVYAVGELGRPTLWKNGEATNLSEEFGDARSIYVTEQ